MPSLGIGDCWDAAARHDIELRYRNYCELGNCFAGKIMLCQHGDFIELWGYLKPMYGLTRAGEDGIRTFLRRMTEDKQRSLQTFGEHANIMHQGNPIGGAMICVVGNKVLVAGKSGDYGPIDDDDLRKCLPEHMIERVI